MGSPAVPSVEAITERDFSSLERVWRALLAADPTATVFQTWEWNWAWWRHLGQGREPLILIAHGAEGPLALAPLAYRRGAGGLFRRLEFLGTGVSDYLQFIGPSETMRACARAFLDFVLQAGRWDVVDLQQLNPAQGARCGWQDGPPCSGEAPGVAAVRWSAQDVCPVVELPDDWAGVLQRIGKKMRQNVSYYERLLRREHAVRFDLAEGEGVRPALEDFFRLHAQRWRRRWLPGALYSGRVRQFHRSVAPALAERGYLALHRLLVDERAVAALYCFHYGGRAFYYLGGFDPELARYSPGTVLTAHAMRHALECGCREFDFLRGREAYKYRWPVVERVNSRLEIGRGASWWSRLALRWNAWGQQLQQVARGALQKA